MWFSTSYDFAEKEWCFEKEQDYTDFAEFVNKHLATKEKYDQIRIVAAPAAYSISKPISVEKVKEIVNLLKQLSELE